MHRASEADTSITPEGPQPPQGLWPVSPGAAAWAEEGEPEIDLMEYVRLVWAKKWIVLGVAATVVFLAVGWAATRTPRYRATAKIAMSPAPQLSQNQFDVAMNWWQMDRFITDQVEILTTYRLAGRVAHRLGLADHPDFIDVDAAKALQASLEVEPVRDSFVIDVSLEGNDAEVVAEWLNVYIDEHTRMNIEDNIERTRQVYGVIQSRLDPLRERVTASEQALIEFQEAEGTGLVADQDRNLLQQQVDRLTAEYATAKAERIRLETRLAAVEALGTDETSAAAFSEVQNDRAVQNLLQDRNRLEVQLAEKLQVMKEGHPQIKELRSQLELVDRRIADQIAVLRTTIRTDFEIAQGGEQRLLENLQALRDQTLEQQRQAMDRERLEREYEQNRSFLEDMLARSKEADISSTATVNNVRVVEPAVPPKAPFSPNIPRTAVLALVLGGFLGVGLVLGLDYLDQTVRTPDQAEHYLGQEVLTALPKFGEDSARVLRESFQALRTAVMLAARGDGCHVLMVTSTTPSEGKTTVSFNLAKILATGGARVLLIDADLRKPRLHRVIRAKNVRGLTSVVLGERTIAEVMHATTDVPDLHIVTSGPLPPNPPELFGKPSFKAILDEARTAYDWVIIDTPPVASVTDPVMCARVVDMLVLVVEYGGPRRQLVRDGLRMLQRSGVRVAGLVLNKVDIERDHYYYSSYYAYYHYGSYGENPPGETPAETDQDDIKL